MAVWGFADLHAHPASHLGFGARGFGAEPGPEKFGIFWGKPGLSADSTNIEADLPPCNALHTYPDDHGGNLIPQVMEGTRATVLDTITAITGEPHRHNGAPAFNDWPHARSLLHQQMHITWIKRAHQGGLRLLIASVTDNEVLSMLWHRYHSARQPAHDPNYDYQSARKQLGFIREMVAANADWMVIVTTPAQARQAIGQNRLAVILSLELDKLTVEQMVALKDEFGVCHVTPIHLVDNSFGGVAVYNDAFNTSNHYLNGRFFQVEGEPSTRFKLSRPQYLYYQGFNLFEPYGAMLPTPISDADYHALGYPTDQGHVNVAGIDFGRLHMLMAHGFIIDLAHMSEHSQEQTLRMVEQFRYPVMNSHTGLRRADDGSVQGSEREMPRQYAQRIAALHGVIGLGTSREDAVIGDDPVSTWVGHYLDTLEAMGGRGVALGTDMNGFAPQIPFARSNMPIRYPIDIGIRLAPPESRGTMVALDRHQLGVKTYDFSRDGIAHYGMLPDFLQAVHTQLAASGRDADGLLRYMFSTAEDTIAMWERVEEAAHRVRTWDKPAGTIPLDLYWSANRQDHFTTATEEGRRDALVAGYVHVRTEGYVFEAPATGLVPLKLFYSSERGDNFTTAAPDGFRDAEAARYREVARSEGYLSRNRGTGMVPIEQFWKDTPRHDNLLTASSGTMEAARNAGYSLVRREGFIFPSAVALRTPNGMFLYAEGGGGGELKAIGSRVAQWETFQVLYLDGQRERIALRAHNGYYVSVTDSTTPLGVVSATGLGALERERFQMIRIDDTHIALRAFNGRFVTAEGGGGGIVTANRTTRADWEIFEVVAV